jgi:chemotaxis protein methyltransferase CheR
VTNILAEIIEVVRRETGIALPAARERAILAAVRRAAPGHDPGAFVRVAACSGSGLVDRLIDEVTVQETAFARDSAQLDTIAWHGLLEGARASGSGTIRVWSAGCASGEEAYTLALLAADAFAPAPAPVDVLGTDISRAALARAEAGRYRGRAVRALGAPLRQRYLDRQADGSYLVGGLLRGLVRFRRHNLARDPIPPPGETGFDLVACRNVLIYFDAPLVARVIESLGRALRPDGMLVLGAADALQRNVGGVTAGSGPRTRPGPRADPAWAPGKGRRRPLGREAPPSREEWLTAALDAAGRGDRDSARTRVARLLADNPFDAEAHFIDGLVTMEAGDPARAAAALRRALYADDAFGLAAFALGRVYDTLGDVTAARRAYEQALRTLDPEDDRHERLLEQVDIGDIAAACRTRLTATRAGPRRGPPGSQASLDHVL